MQRIVFFFGLTLFFSGVAMLGCVKENPPPPAASGDDHSDHDDHDHAHHDHGETGPHGGHLIELGGGEYHAEWTHDNPSEQEDAKNVTIYILGEDAKTEVPIEAEQITINVSGGKAAQQFHLGAVNATDGKASQFSLDDPGLVVALGMAGEGVTARLNVTIDGEPYNSVIEHHHHDHAHDHHDHAH